MKSTLNMNSAPILCLSDVLYLPYLELGTLPDVFPTLPGPTGDDDYVGPIPISGLGFYFGPELKTTVYVCSLGVNGHSIVIN